MATRLTLRSFKHKQRKVSIISRCALPPGVTLLDSNATANIDFASEPKEVYFQSGQLELSRDIVIYDDDLLEGKEIFIARLTHPQGGVVREPSDAIITIIDDEGR